MVVTPCFSPPDLGWSPFESWQVVVDETLLLCCFHLITNRRNVFLFTWYAGLPLQPLFIKNIFQWFLIRNPSNCHTKKSSKVQFTAQNLFFYKTRESDLDLLSILLGSDRSTWNFSVVPCFHNYSQALESNFYYVIYKDVMSRIKAFGKSLVQTQNMAIIKTMNLQ